MVFNPIDAVNAAKEIGELVKKYNDIPLYEKIIALQGQVVELASDRLALFQANQELKEKLESRAKITWKSPYYFKEEDDVPLCPKCYETSKGDLIIHLPHPPQTLGQNRRRDCHTCHTTFYDDGVYHERENNDRLIVRSSNWL